MNWLTRANWKGEQDFIVREVKNRISLSWSQMQTGSQSRYLRWNGILSECQESLMIWVAELWIKAKIQWISEKISIVLYNIMNSLTFYCFQKDKVAILVSYPENSEYLPLYGNSNLCLVFTHRPCSPTKWIRRPAFSSDTLASLIFRTENDVWSMQSW